MCEGPPGRATELQLCVCPCITPEQNLGKPQQHSCNSSQHHHSQKKRGRNGNKKGGGKLGVRRLAWPRTPSANRRPPLVLLCPPLSSCCPVPRCPLLRGKPGRQTRELLHNPELMLRDGSSLLPVRHNLSCNTVTVAFRESQQTLHNQDEQSSQKFMMKSVARSYPSSYKGECVTTDISTSPWLKK